MRLLVPIAAGLMAVALPGQQSPTVQASNELFDIRAEVVTEKKAVRDLLGAAPPTELVVLKLTVSPRDEKPFSVSRDSFTLVSSKDGQRSTPFAPSQLGGKGGLVVREQKVSGGWGMMNRGPMIPVNPGGTGRPVRMGGDQDVISNGKEGKVETQADKSGPNEGGELLSVLKKRELPAQVAGKPVEGLLYFSFEGKVKPKDLTLMYKGEGGKMTLEFQQR